MTTKWLSRQGGPLLGYLHGLTNKKKKKVVKYDALDASGKHSLVWYKLFCTSFNGNIYGTKLNLNTD